VSTPTHSARPAQSGNAALGPDQLEVAPGREKEAVEGWVPNLATEEELRQALEKAFDYRGDVTITRKDGTVVDGYIFDRVGGKTLETSFVRVLPKDSSQRLRIAYGEIAALAFSGRDPAAGKSWEAWVKKYWDKRQSGEGSASIEPNSLDE
jgi:hypothetical protein